MILIGYIEYKIINPLLSFSKIERYIESVEDSEIRQIMRFRFMDLMSWNDIADQLHYERTTVAKKLRQFINSHNSHWFCDIDKLGEKIRQWKLSFFVSYEKNYKRYVKNL